MAEELKYQVEVNKHKSEVNGFVCAIEKLNPDKAAEAGLIALLMSIQGRKCTFCGGLGHHVKQCSSKINVDKSCKEVPAFRQLWGTLKGAYKSTGKRTMA